MNPVSFTAARICCIDLAGSNAAGAGFVGRLMSRIQAAWRASTATMLAAALMLDYVGFADAARRLERAIEAVYAAGDSLTPDQGGAATTEQFARAVRERL